MSHTARYSRNLRYESIPPGAHIGLTNHLYHKCKPEAPSYRYTHRRGSDGVLCTVGKMALVHFNANMMLREAYPPQWSKDIKKCKGFNRPAPSQAHHLCNNEKNGLRYLQCTVRFASNFQHVRSLRRRRTAVVGGLRCTWWPHHPKFYV
jgi:hypothetical protein